MKRWYEIVVVICMLTSFIGLGVALLALPCIHWYHTELRQTNYYAGLAGVIGVLPFVVGLLIGFITRKYIVK